MGESLKKEKNGGIPFGMLKIDDIESIWMSQKEMAELFKRDVSVINRHVDAVKSELAEWEGLKVTLAKRAIVTPHGAMKGKTRTTEEEIYAFDFICQVGYKISGMVGMQFRQYATQAIKEKIVRDYNQQHATDNSKIMSLEKANETYKALIIEYFHKWQSEKYNREQDEKIFHIKEAKDAYGKPSKTGRPRTRVRKPAVVSGKGRAMPMPSELYQPDVFDSADAYNRLGDVERDEKLLLNE